MKDRFIRLRRAANIASGGIASPVFDKIHPDNRDLAERAAAALRLDFAGIDLLIPDIATSWRKTGAAICEVNAQPSMGQVTTGHLYAPILRKLVSGDGRIPTVLVLGAAPQSNLVLAIEMALHEKGIAGGGHDQQGVRFAGQSLMEGNVSAFVAGSALAANRNVRAMVLSIHDAAVLRSGLAFARYDLLVVAGSYLALSPELDKPQRERILTDVVASLLPACDGKVVTMQGSGFQTRGLQRFTSAACVEPAIPPPQLVAAIVNEIMAFHAKHQ